MKSFTRGVTGTQKEDSHHHMPEKDKLKIKLNQIEFI